VVLAYGSPDALNPLDPSGVSVDVDNGRVAIGIWAAPYQPD